MPRSWKHPHRHALDELNAAADGFIRDRVKIRRLNPRVGQVLDERSELRSHDINRSGIVHPIQVRTGDIDRSPTCDLGCVPNVVEVAVGAQHRTDREVPFLDYRRDGIGSSDTGVEDEGWVALSSRDDVTIGIEHGGEACVNNHGHYPTQTWLASRSRLSHPDKKTPRMAANALSSRPPPRSPYV